MSVGLLSRYSSEISNHPGSGWTCYLYRGAVRSAWTTYGTRYVEDFPQAHWKHSAVPALRGYRAKLLGNSQILLLKALGESNPNYRKVENAISPWYRQSVCHVRLSITLYLLMKLLGVNKQVSCFYIVCTVHQLVEGNTLTSHLWETFGSWDIPWAKFHNFQDKLLIQMERFQFLTRFPKSPYRWDQNTFVNNGQK